MPRYLVSFALALVAALPMAAQQFPAQQRGLTADTAYSSGDLDTVNLFNGNLSLSIPLGQAYSVGPSFSLGFSLNYNSKVWDYDEKTCQQPPGQNVSYQLPSPDKYANAGLGWLLTPGRLLDPSIAGGTQNTLNPGPNWVYVSADGGHHAFYSRLHPGYPASPSSAGTLYSNDGTYLRQKKLSPSECRSVAGTSGDCRIVEFPDGSRHEFLSFAPFNWRVVRMADSFGNQVDVDYRFTPQGQDLDWTFKDPHGREQKVEFENGRVRWLRLTAFGGKTATWEFIYQTVTIPRHRYFPPNCVPAAPATTVQVALLTRIVRPDSSYFDFAYNTTDQTLSGAINFLRYPTGGSLAWTYQTYGFPQDDGSAQNGPWATSAGVATKTMANTGGTAVGTWTYDVKSAGNPVGPGQNKAPCFHTTTVIDPLGQATESFFSSVENSHFWAYGLPYTYCDPETGVYEDQSGAFLSQRIWPGAAGIGTPLRSTYVEYDTDGQLSPADQNRNHRLRYRKTVYEDDDDRWVEETHSDFDGLGHWRQTVAAGNFGPSKTSTTTYRPGGGTLLLGDDSSLPLPGNSFAMPAESDRWLFGTFTRSSVRQGSGAEIVSEHCFDSDTGFLTRSRQLAGVVPQGFDLLTVNLPEEGTGFLASQRFYGGDGAALPTSYSSLCAMNSPTGDPAYRVDHGWSAGSLSTSAWIDPCDSSTVLRVADADIDQGTGLVARVRDAAGLATSLDYDVMSRFVTEMPDEGAWSNTAFKYPKLGQSPPDLPSVEMESCPWGQEDCSGTSRGFSRYKEFDGVGRLDREALALPAEGDPSQNQDRKFTYNALGWRLTESTWQQQKNTTYSGFDRFGRAGLIQPPGASPGIAISYLGARRTTRKTRVETVGGLADNWVTEERDHFGRLVAVCEAQATEPGATGCSGLLTTYSYDAADRLIGVCSRPNGSTCGQTRSFAYDGRGFLLADTHPETGPTGNGATTYEYDALGHLTRSQIAGSADFELRSSYDRAGRLVLLEQKAGAIWKPLKEFFYARESDGIGWQGGKLVLAKRHNWVGAIGPESLGDLDAVVADAYEYEGIGGRISKKTTSFRFGSGTNAFESTFNWDDFGNLASLTYPEPLNWPLNRFANPRQVDFGYTLGFLTKVDGFAPQISYQLGGLLNKVHYDSGATFTQEFNPADHLPRTYRLTLAGVSAPFATGNYVYDGESHISQIGSLLFRFDRLGRLVRGDVPNGAGTATQTASFDDFGNLTSLNTGGSVQSLATDAATNRLSGAAYDAAGNLTGVTLAGHWEYSFDGLRKMYGLRSNTNQARLFFYDASDERVFTWDCPQSSCNPDHDQERWTLRGLGGEVLRSYSGTGKFTTEWEEDYVYRGGALLGTISKGAIPGEEEKRFVAVDHLGSVRLVFGENNQTVDRFDFFPFGQESGSVGQGELALKFTGHERDPNGTGKGLLDYMHARFGSPITGRFLSVDPVLGRAAQPQSWNRYSYALNNPINYTDPTGETTANQIVEGAQQKISDFKQVVADAAFDILPSGGAIVFATWSGSWLDQAAGLLDPLRFGDAVGTAAGGDASAGEMTLAVVQDTARGVGVVSAAGSAAGKVLNRAPATVDLFRAVSPAEFSDILTTGQFRAAAGTLEAKQFGLSLHEIISLADDLPEAAAVIRARIPASSLKHFDLTPLDPQVLRSGTVSVQPDKLNYFNNIVRSIEQVY